VDISAKELIMKSKTITTRTEKIFYHHDIIRIDQKQYKINRIFLKGKHLRKRNMPKDLKNTFPCNNSQLEIVIHIYR
jgi:hypothetical protein